MVRKDRMLSNFSCLVFRLGVQSKSRVPVIRLGHSELEGPKFRTELPSFLVKSCESMGCSGTLQFQDVIVDVEHSRDVTSSKLSEHCTLMW